MTTGIRLLWADDQREFVEAHMPLVRSLVGTVQICPDGQAALAAVESFRPDVILLDLQMPPGEWGGLWLLRQMGPALRYVPTIVISGEGSMSECIEAQDLGAFRYVEKERIDSELPRKLSEAIERLGTVRAGTDYVRLRYLERTIHGLVVAALQVEARRRGDADIFRSVVPRVMAMKTYERMLEQGTGDQEGFMDLLDLTKLIEIYWSSCPSFLVLERIVRPSRKDDRVAWLARLNEPRKLIAHPLRGELRPQDRDVLVLAEEITARWLVAAHTESDE